MNHLQILYFLTVAQCRSFSEAARQLFVAQSAISKQIQSLETSLGFKLFIRTNRTVELTPAGEIMFRELQKYYDWLDQIINMARQVDQGKKGVLNIGVSHGLDLSIDKLNNLSGFLNYYPDIHVNAQRIKLEELVNELQRGSHDIIITYSFLFQGIQKVAEAVLETEEDRIIVSKNHPLGKKRELQPQDFTDYQLITISPEYSRYAYMQSLNYFSGLGISPQKISLVPTIEDIMLSVELGLGYGIVSKSSRLNKYKDDAFRVINMYEKMGAASPKIQILALWRTDSVNSSVKAFEDYVKNKLGLEVKYRLYK